MSAPVTAPVTAVKEPLACGTCQGSGQVPNDAAESPWAPMRSVCPACSGTGHVECGHCQGLGCVEVMVDGEWRDVGCSWCSGTGQAGAA